MHRVGPNVPAVQEDICLEVHQVAYPYRQVAGTAYLQEAILHSLVAGKETGASLEVVRRPCVVEGRAACWAAFRQDPGACLAVGRVAFRLVALGL